MWQQYHVVQFAKLPGHVRLVKKDVESRAGEQTAIK
jgi:hypothetical protein